VPENPWADEAIAATLDEVGLSPGVDAALPDIARFVRGVRDVLAASAERHGALTAPAVFVLAPQPGPLDDAPSHPRIHTGEVNAGGHLWAVGAAAKSARYVPFPDHALDAIFNFCVELGLGDAPAVLFDAAATPQRFAWYPSGLVVPDEVIEGPVELEQTPSLADLLEVVERVYRTRLMTTYNQNADTKLWEKTTHHWAHERAEKRVQDALLTGLGGRFGRPYFADQEISGDAGRYDIGFRKKGTNGVVQLLAVLELKVARAFGSTGTAKSEAETEGHVSDGIDQARAYANERAAQEAACLVFDLRKTENQTVAPALTTRAAQRVVHLQFWRCFPTAEDYRTFALPEIAG
jgi:hypothetical protein